MNKYVKTMAALMSLMVAMALFSCEKGEKFDETTLSLSQKWDITTSSSPYASFEFNKDGMYIVIEKGYGARSLASTDGAAGKRSLLQRRGSATEEVSLRADSPGIHIGRYTIGKDGITVDMTGFGKVEIVDIKSDLFDFIFTHMSGSSSTFQAKKSNDLVSSSSRTELFCRYWVFDKATIDESRMDPIWKEELKAHYGSNWKSSAEKEFNEEMKGSTVLFTRAGTYVEYYPDYGWGEEYDHGFWKWANSAENVFYLAETYMGEFQWWWDDEPIEILELTASKLKYHFPYDDEDGLIMELKIAR